MAFRLERLHGLAGLLAQFACHDYRLAFLLVELADTLGELAVGNIQRIDYMAFVEFFLIANVDYDGVTAVD